MYSTGISPTRVEFWAEFCIHQNKPECKTRVISLISEFGIPVVFSLLQCVSTVFPMCLNSADSLDFFPLLPRSCLPIADFSLLSARMPPVLAFLLWFHSEHRFPSDLGVQNDSLQAGFVLCFVSIRSGKKVTPPLFPPFLLRLLVACPTLEP